MSANPFQSQDQHDDQGRRSTHASGVVPLRPSYVDDKLLWDAFRDGDDDALITIFDRYADSMFRYGCKIVPDRDIVRDSVQDLFLTLCQKREKLGETNTIKFYLFKALRRNLIRIKPNTSIALSAVADPPAPSPEDELIHEQTIENRKRLLDQRLASLAPRQREAIFLRYYEELSYDKIAEIMGVRKQSIYNLINESIAILRSK